MLKLIIILAAVAVYYGQADRIYRLYTRGNSKPEFMKIGDNGLPATFVPANKTIILIHGHRGSVGAPFNTRIIQEIFDFRREHNIIVVDWETEASYAYSVAYSYVIPVANDLARFLRWLAVQTSIEGNVTETPATETPVPETPAPETPAPETPTPETPAPETPVPETPAPETPAPETPAPETPPPETPAPETPAPETPAPETPAPETPAPETPAPETPAPETPAPETPAPETPAPETPAPETPAPETPAPETPAPETPAPETPAPETPAPETPAPETPAPETPAPETPAPETPAPETPAPETPPPETPAPETPAPETPAPETPAPETPAPVTPAPETLALKIPAPAIGGSAITPPVPLVLMEKLHLVGFGLGAHIAGIASRQLKDSPGLVGRITGLDPAGSGWGSRSPRLNDKDANYVEVIHTDGTGILANGIGTEIGDIDFYANGGSNQPGCFSHACSHERAWELFAASMRGHLVGYRCSSKTHLHLNLCKGHELRIGGTELTKEARYGDIYRVNTRRNYPF